MTNEKVSRTAQTPAKTAQAQRQAKLASALRSNLHKRKAQSAIQASGATLSKLDAPREK
ncbi:MAG: hypothetical protein IPI58_01005 [Alphaproteobacteria bacterium]|nr:MAG: hypothetical protein IPI58_01005 [Alphaproteobacteria bacterium]